MGLRSDNSYTILVSHRSGKRGGVMGLPGAYEETFSRRHYRFPTGRYEDRRIFLARIGAEIFLHRRRDRAAEILVFDAEGNEVDPEYFVKVYDEVSRKYHNWRNAISLKNPRKKLNLKSTKTGRRRPTFSWGPVPEDERLAIIEASDRAEARRREEEAAFRTIRDLVRQVRRHMRELNKQWEKPLRPRPALLVGEGLTADVEADVVERIATFDRAWDELSRSRVFLASDQRFKDDVRRAVENDIRLEEYELRRRNPMRRNAGRHFRRGKKVRDHGEFYMGAYEGEPTLFAMSKDELVEMGTAAAIKELRRRGRDRDGVKLAWKKYPVVDEEE